MRLSMSSTARMLLLLLCGLCTCTSKVNSSANLNKSLSLILYCSRRFLTKVKMGFAFVTVLGIVSRYPSVRNSRRGTAKVERCSTCRTGHLLSSVVREALLLLSSWGESSRRMFTSSVFPQIKKDPLLVMDEFFWCPAKHHTLGWLFERLEGNYSRMLFYNLWSFKVPFILLYLHAGSRG